MKRRNSTGVVVTIVVCSFLVILGIARDSVAVDRSAVEDFVTRFYQLCLDRDPDPTGLDGWVSALLNGSQAGSDVANGFIFSPEFTSKNTNNEEYLMILYEAFFNRSPDQGGWDGWLSELNGGADRADVLNGFIYAQEFNNLCWGYGISPNPVDAFVTRFYRLCLDREPDEVGLNGWVSALLDGALTGSDAAHGFVFSQEFINKNTTNDEYLTVLYEAFFSRQPDSAGRQGWMDALISGSSREDVLNGFIFATEFIELCNRYNILPFDPLKKDDDGDGFTEFAGDCNDSNPNIHPAANEICGDGIDQDCNGSDLICSACANIAGDWYASETITLTCCLDGDCETDSFSGTDTVTIQQNECNISYDIDIRGYGTYTRTGTIAANKIQLSGIFVVLQPWCTAAQNVVNINGTVNGDQMNLQGSGRVNGTCDGDSFSCTGNSTASLSRLSSSVTSKAMIGKESIRESSTPLLNNCARMLTVLDY